MTTTAATVDLFWYAESNRVEPSSQPALHARAEVPAGLEPWEMILAARGAGHRVSLGSSRTGVHEVQTDDGVWQRIGANRRERSTWVFNTWDELATAE
jgi:hypothetical protein